MNLTIKNDNFRFSLRVAAIIYNKNMDKIFVEKNPKHDFYVFPGGRVETNEDTDYAIKRELKEELNIEEEMHLNFISENFIKFPNLNYHEVGFYYLIKIDEDKYGYNLDKEYESLDASDGIKSKFMWVDIKDIENFNIIPKHLKSKIKNKELKFNNNIEHFIYREYS